MDVPKLLLSCGPRRMDKDTFLGNYVIDTQEV